MSIITADRAGIVNPDGLKKVDTTNYWLFEEEVKHPIKLAKQAACLQAFKACLMSFETDDRLLI
jgi:hypothetical protein